MVRSFITIGVVVLCVFTSQVNAQLFEYRGHDATLEEFITNYNSFAWDFFQRLTHKVKNTSNFMVSPFPIWTLLLVTAEGATDRTLSQLKTTLGIERNFDVISEYYEKLESALDITSIPGNVMASRTIFPNIDIIVNHTYERISQISYKTAVIPAIYRLPKHAKDFINTYVNTDTNGLIETTIDEQDISEANLILYSSTFFRGQWKFPFTQIFPLMFNDEYGRPQKIVNLMYVRANFRNFQLSEINTDVFELPLGNEDRFSMIIFLPAFNTTVETATGYVAKLGLTSILDKLKQAMEQNTSNRLEIFLPQFRTSTDFLLNPILEEMGIVEAFDAAKAKFPKISKTASYISKIFHQTVIEVDITGTPEPTNKYNYRCQRKLVNRPFAYAVVDKLSKSLLLCGQVVNPSLFTN